MGKHSDEAADRAHQSVEDMMTLAQMTAAERREAADEEYQGRHRSDDDPGRSQSLYHELAAGGADAYYNALNNGRIARSSAAELAGKDPDAVPAPTFEPGSGRPFGLDF